MRPPQQGSDCRCLGRTRRCQQVADRTFSMGHLSHRENPDVRQDKCNKTAESLRHMMSASTRNRTWDVIVVGARCAGAATAMLLARAGLDVLVLEAGRAGSDTMSTHALM